MNSLNWIHKCYDTPYVVHCTLYTYITNTDCMNKYKIGYIIRTCIEHWASKTPSIFPCFSWSYSFTFLSYSIPNLRLFPLWIKECQIGLIVICLSMQKYMNTKKKQQWTSNIQHIPLCCTCLRSQEKRKK